MARLRNEGLVPDDSDPTVDVWRSPDSDNYGSLIGPLKAGEKESADPARQGDQETVLRNQNRNWIRSFALSMGSRGGAEN